MIALSNSIHFPPTALHQAISHNPARDRFARAVLIPLEAASNGDEYCIG